jgi:integrase
MFFTEAAPVWLNSCTLPVETGTVGGRYIKSNTEVSYRQYCESLALFFGRMPLGRIHEGNLREFQRLRLAGAEPFIRRRRPHEEPGPCPVKPKKANQELALLRRIMQEGGAWNSGLELWWKRHRLVEEEPEQQRALEPEEQELWLRTAASRARWQLVHWYSILGIGCTLGTNELQYQRVGDINLWHRTIAVAGKGVKCRGRKRVIALLTAEELWAAEKLLERARECGSKDPQDYVMPWRNKKYDWDPKKPMSTSGVKREWQEVREATGLLWFRQYDLRHTGGTRLAEQGWRTPQIKARMGHITDQMSEHYTHISESAQRREYERVRSQKFGPGSVRPERMERKVAW